MTFQTPHDQCKALDVSGQAYWLRRVTWQDLPRAPGTAITTEAWGNFAILSHGPDWVRLQAPMKGQEKPVSFWKRWDDLRSFQIFTEGD